MTKAREALFAKKVKVGIAVGCTAALLFGLGVAAGIIGESDASSVSDGNALGGGDGNGKPYETIPCTKPEEPVNFEVYSAGPEVADLPLTETLRVCENENPHPGEAPANKVTYIYGDCPYRKAGDTGCPPPLAVETWPACQRSLASYTYNGKPFPHQDVSNELSGIGGAKVVYFNVFGEPRLEVYTKEATVVVFAKSSALAIKAIENLHTQDVGTPPADSAEALVGDPEELAPPRPGATKGTLECNP